jgi:hypothetical protein
MSRIVCITQIEIEFGAVRTRPRRMRGTGNSAAAGRQ